MYGRWKLSLRKPSHIVEFVRLTIACFRLIHEHLEVESNPVIRLSTVLHEHIAISEKFFFNNVGEIFLFYFTNKRFLDFTFSREDSINS